MMVVLKIVIHNKSCLVKPFFEFSQYFLISGFEIKSNIKHKIFSKLQIHVDKISKKTLLCEMKIL